MAKQKQNSTDNAVHYFNLLKTLQEGSCDDIVELRAKISTAKIFKDVLNLESTFAYLVKDSDNDENKNIGVLTDHIEKKITELKELFLEDEITSDEYTQEIQELFNWYICTKLALHERTDIFEQFLSKHKCDIHFADDALLEYLIASNKNTCAKAIIKEHPPELANGGYSILCKAVLADNFEMVDLLIDDLGVNPNQEKPTIQFKYFPKSDSPLFLYAIRRDRADNHRMLKHLAEVHNLDFDKNTALLAACRAQNSDIVTYLLNDDNLDVAKKLEEIIDDYQILSSPETFKAVIEHSSVPKKLLKAHSNKAITSCVAYGFLSEPLLTLIERSKGVPKSFSASTWFSFSDSMQYQEMETVPLGLIALAEKGCDLSPLENYSPTAYQDIKDILALREKVSAIREEFNAQKEMKKGLKQTKNKIQKQQAGHSVKLKRRR